MTVKNKPGKKKPKKIMRKFKSLLAVAAATATALSATAQTSEQLIKHAHPMSDADAQTFMAEYVGATKYDGTNWEYTKNSRYGSVKQPTKSVAGDLFFVTVNDYWYGKEWKGNVEDQDIYTQVKYGIKSIDKVTNKQDIPSGTLYSYTASTNRFFFLARTKTFCETDGSRNGTTNAITWTRYKYTTTYYAKPEGGYYYPFRWYNEFSATASSVYNTEPYKSTGSYDSMSAGEFYPVPHVCSNLLMTNHFTTLYPAETIGQVYTDRKIFFYVPSGTDIFQEYKTGKYTDTQAPQIFFYMSDLSGTLQTSTSTTSGYVAKLDWSTSFKKAQDNAKITFTPWKSGQQGVREEITIYRRIPAIEKYKEWEVIKEGVKDNIIDIYTDNDNNLPAPGDAGYEVQYYIVTKAVKYNANGTREGSVIGETETNFVTLVVPGKQKFIISLGNDFTSKYSPSTATGAARARFNQSKNHIENTVAAQTTVTTPAPSSLSVGDIFVLKRLGDSGKDVCTVEITSISSSGSNYTFTYKLNGSSTTKTVTCNGNIANLLALMKTTDKDDITPGSGYAAQYELVYQPKTGETIYSNIVSAASLATDVSTKILYRSGSPAPDQNATQELYTVEVSFKPVLNVAHYHIWQNAEKAIIRIVQPAVGSKECKMLIKDENGNFNIELPNTIKIGDDGYIRYRVNAPIDRDLMVHKGEGDINSKAQPFDNDLFFTVEVCQSDNITFGNVDVPAQFTGNIEAQYSELVVNTTGEFYVGEGKVAGNYRAQITWDAIKDKVFITDSQDAEAQVEPKYYTVYRKADGETSFSPVTTFKRGKYIDDYKAGIKQKEIDGKIVNLWDEDEYGNIIYTSYVDVPGVHAVDGAYVITPDFMTAEATLTGSADFVMIDMFENKTFTPEGENVFPAVYYVTAHYDDVPTTDANISKAPAQNIAHDNLLEKNSNVARASKAITTGVEEVNVDSEVVKTVYYNLQGVEVMNPAAGDIVVARYQHADGTITSKVIRK